MIVSPCIRYKQVPELKTDYTYPTITRLFCPCGQELWCSPRLKYDMVKQWNKNHPLPSITMKPEPFHKVIREITRLYWQYSQVTLYASNDFLNNVYYFLKEQFPKIEIEKYDDKENIKIEYYNFSQIGEIHI